MPFIVRWPGHTPAARVDENSVLSGVDLFPTLCTAAGATIPQDIANQLDGQNVLSAFEGKTFTREKHLLWEYGRKPRGQGYGYPKNKHNVSPNVAIREGKWKLLVNADGTRQELYDIVTDKNETKNVVAGHKAMADRMTSTALEWRKSLPAPHYSD
jgi:arylsulfatase A-like enzyme